MSNRCTSFVLLILALLTAVGCQKDTRPVPHTLGGDELYSDYTKQRRGYPMTIRESSTVLARTDLKSTGNYTPKGWPNDGGNIRFIYGGTHYWAYINNPRNPRDEPMMYGPFELP
jgi:hypothetical protein